MVVVLFTLIGVMTLFLLYGYLSNWLLGVNEYPMGISNLPRGMEGIKIVHLSDLHGCRFGKENERLLSKIKMIQPNLILMSGDMIVKDGKGSEALIELCKELVKLCPVYYSLGNHETRYDDWLEVQKKLCDMQVIVLDNETLVSDSGFCVAGLTLDAKSYDKIWKKPTVEDGSLEQLLGKK